MGSRPYREAVEDTATAEWKGNMTKQRVQNLDSFGGGRGQVAVRPNRSVGSYADDASAYPDLVASMLALVLKRIPASLQARAEVGLVRRWNREWGVGMGESKAEEGRTGPGPDALDLGMATVRRLRMPARAERSTGL